MICDVTKPKIFRAWQKILLTTMATKRNGAIGKCLQPTKSLHPPMMIQSGEVALEDRFPTSLSFSFPIRD
jgi:hypothetical protein